MIGVLKNTRVSLYESFINTCTARHFHLLRKPSLNVPMYAYRLGLLVFGASLTSAILSLTE